MDRRFAADEWKKLTVSERVHRCKLLAREAQDLAGTSDYMREHYIDLADQWLKLAEEMVRAKRAVS